MRIDIIVAIRIDTDAEPPPPLTPYQKARRTGEALLALARALETARDDNEKENTD